jgi:tRNA(fMet)-specific endonuclease VapC
MPGPLYLLDTNIVVHAMRGHANILKRMRKAGQSNLVLSSLVAAQLAYGVEKSLHKDKNKVALVALLSAFTVAAWDESAIWHYAAHFHRLRSAGTPIGELDLLIGCQALALKAICVTNNTREFARIDGLKLENWVD